MPLLLLSKSQPLALGCDLVLGANLENLVSIVFCYSIMYKPRFSNCFIEKRGLLYMESLVPRGFPLFMAFNPFLKFVKCLLDCAS